MREVAFHVKHEASCYPQASVDNVTMIHITPSGSSGWLWTDLWITPVETRVVVRCPEEIGSALHPSGRLSVEPPQIPPALLESSSMGADLHEINRRDPRWTDLGQADRKGTKGAVTGRKRTEACGLDVDGLDCTGP